MTFSSIAIMSPGDMGHNVGRALREHGYRIVTCLAGRSPRTRELAQKAGFEVLSALEDLLNEADLLLSIMPPAAATAFAVRAATALRAVSDKPYYADCNAVSPQSAQRIGAIIEAAGARFIDAGIIGPAPGKGAAPRFWASGEHAAVLDELQGKSIVVKYAGPEIGQASAVKMCYAALTKGTWALQTAVLMAAERQGLSDLLHWELEHSQAAWLKQMHQRVPWLAADAERWVGEMEEIAGTFTAAGITGDFHQGAAAVFRQLAATPLAAETRETLDKSRSLREAVACFVKAVD